MLRDWLSSRQESPQLRTFSRPLSLRNLLGYIAPSSIEQSSNAYLGTSHLNEPAMFEEGLIEVRVRKRALQTNLSCQ
jgi:hypothetical protein